ALIHIPPPTLTFTTGPRCVGTPAATTCSILNSTSCPTTPGCNWDTTVMGSCIGTSVACTSKFTQLTCEGLTGCAWNATTPGSCAGTSYTCSNHFTQASCEAQPGCMWPPIAGTCSGTTYSCGTHLTSASCV